MKKACASTAKSTKEPCKWNALPGSRYCIFHVEKTPLLYGVIVSAILGYLLSWILPSRELAEFRRFRDEVKPVLMPLAKSLHPELDDKAALIALLDELKKSFELGGIIEYEWIMGSTYPAVKPYDPDPNLVSALSSLLDHTDPSVREAAKTCLKSLRCDKAIKILQEKSKK